MSGGRGRIGFLVRNMAVGQWYEPKDVEELFKEKKDDPNNIWKEVTRNESKALIGSLLRRHCYHTDRRSNPRRVMLVTAFVDEEVAMTKSQRRALVTNGLISKKWVADGH